eukprot:1463166-Prorocentrum_lima.AAC.1
MIPTRSLLRTDHPKLYLIQFLLGSDYETLEFQETFPDTPHLGGVPVQPANGSQAPGGLDPPLRA